MAEESPLLANIARLEAATEAVREAERSAHETIATLRLLLKQGDQLKGELSALAAKHVTEHMDEVLTQGLERYKVELMEAMDKSRDRVMREFTRIGNTLMYGNVAGTGPNVLQQLAYARGVYEQELGNGDPGTLPITPLMSSPLNAKGKRKRKRNMRDADDE